MKVWIVMGEVPYESSYVVHVCADEVLAKFLRDWCEAIEINTRFELNKKYDWPVGVYVYFEIEEYEVIL